MKIQALTLQHNCTVGDADDAIDDNNADDDDAYGDAVASCNNKCWSAPTSLRRTIAISRCTYPSEAL